MSHNRVSPTNPQVSHSLRQQTPAQRAKTLVRCFSEQALRFPFISAPDGCDIVDGLNEGKRARSAAGIEVITRNDDHTVRLQEAANDGGCDHNDWSVHSQLETEDPSLY